MQWSNLVEINFLAHSLYLTLCKTPVKFYYKKRTHPRVLTEVTNGLISGLGPTVECKQRQKGVRRKEGKIDVLIVVDI